MVSIKVKEFGRLFLKLIEVRKTLSTNPIINKRILKEHQSKLFILRIQFIQYIQNVWLSKMASIKVLGFGRLFLNHVTCQQVCLKPV